MKINYLLEVGDITAFALVCECKAVFNTQQMPSIKVAVATAPFKICKCREKNKKSLKRESYRFH